jgi:hypothetical protein
MLFGTDRQQLRQMFVDAWRKAGAREPVTPLEDIIASVVALHPEYHRWLDEPAATERDWTPEHGEANPFLHMGMHIAIREQLGAGRPLGIREAHQALLALHGDAHAAEHVMLECLGEVLWQAQRAGVMPDEQRYLELLRARVRS